MIEDDSASVRLNKAIEEEVSAYDVANYAFEMTDQLRRMAEAAGFEALAKTLDLAHDLAARAMNEARRRV
jgi:hypothetical protein